MISLDRYRLVPYPSCSLRLFSLQINLLENFLEDLKSSLTNDQQDIDPLSKNFCSILNSIVYIADVIQQWKNRSVRLSNSFFFLSSKFCFLSIINTYNIYMMNTRYLLKNMAEKIQKIIIQFILIQI